MGKEWVVLVVDDEEIMRRLMKQYLERMGIRQILLAENGEEALGILAKEKVDLIISDWLMPKMDGLDLLKEVRANEDLKEILFLMVTLVDQKEQVVLAVRQGIDEYLVKPLHFDFFSQKVKKLIAIQG
ncbi:MAG: response regulator [Nitrospinae bacterium]|nr:response regulator [Nitrospinota bacterium]